MVRDLIDVNGKVWKENEVKAMFNESDIENILAMLIIDQASEDKQFWQFTTDGDYSVKSIYYHIMENPMDKSGGGGVAKRGREPLIYILKNFILLVLCYYMLLFQILPCVYLSV